MTPAEVVTELVRRVPGRRNALPLIRKGARVSVVYQDLRASGTVRTSYGTTEDSASLVILDGTETEVDVPWDLLEAIEGGP